MNFKTRLYEEIDYRYYKASPSKRFVNYVIDVLFFYVLIFGFYAIISMIDPRVFDFIDDGVTDRIVGLVFYGVIMSFTEAMLNGKSIGKFITKTRAVSLDGSDLSFERIFTRNLIRIIPFEILSAFGYPCSPWHDKWSDSIVVDEKKLALQKQKAHLFATVKNEGQ